MNFQNTTILILSFCLVCQFGICQKSPMSQYGVPKHYYLDSVAGSIGIGIDPITKDTIRQYNSLGKFQVKTERGILIEDGQLLNCGCEFMASGFWIEKFRNGHLKSQGTYYCNEKIGTWIYFYETGELKKIENLERPYNTELSEHRLELIFQTGTQQLSNYGLRNGIYVEFYQNGQIKKEGQYQIVEQFSITDTLFIFDPETYERTSKIIRGEFWKPKSIKIGRWNYYAQGGNLVATEKIKFPNKDPKIRRIKARYQEVFGF